MNFLLMLLRLLLILVHLLCSELAWWVKPEWVTVWVTLLIGVGTIGVFVWQAVIFREHARAQGSIASSLEEFKKINTTLATAQERETRYTQARALIEIVAQIQVLVSETNIAAGEAYSGKVFGNLSREEETKVAHAKLGELRGLVITGHQRLIEAKNAGLFDFDKDGHWKSVSALESYFSALNQACGAAPVAQDRIMQLLDFDRRSYKPVTEWLDVQRHLKEAMKCRPLMALEPMMWQQDKRLQEIMSRFSDAMKVPVSS